MAGSARKGTTKTSKRAVAPVTSAKKSPRSTSSRQDSTTVKPFKVVLTRVLSEHTSVTEALKAAREVKLKAGELVATIAENGNDT